MELLDHLGLDHDALLDARAASADFRMLVPRAYAALMEPANPDDPLLRQVLPAADELTSQIGFSHDPVGDRAARRAPGLLQKYRGRALLVVTGACAVHCRYCFRRHFPYESETIAADRGWAAAALIRKDPEIAEIILSGGDPLMLDDAPLAALVARLADIPHIKRLRIHTRMPIVLPCRITAELCRLLTATRPKVVVVVHANHPRELGQGARGALARIGASGITLLNQSVLLKGVNDQASVLADLSEALFAHGVLPYYLHLLDKVFGAAHFDVSSDRAAELVRDLRKRLPGYLVPQLVREKSGIAYKSPIC